MDSGDLSDLDSDLPDLIQEVGCSRPHSYVGFTAASTQNLILIYTSNKTVYMYEDSITWYKNVAEMLL